MNQQENSYTTRSDVLQMRRERHSQVVSSMADNCDFCFFLTLGPTSFFAGFEREMHDLPFSLVRSFLVVFLESIFSSQLNNKLLFMSDCSFLFVNRRAAVSDSKIIYLRPDQCDKEEIEISDGIGVSQELSLTTINIIADYR